MSTNATKPSAKNPSSIEGSLAHQLGASAGKELCKAANRISNIWRALGKDAANHTENASVSITTQVDFLNDMLQGIRESAPKELVDSKNLGRSVGYMLESYLLARVKVFGNTTSIPYFYQIAGSNESARFHVSDKPAKPAKPTATKTDAPKTDAPKTDAPKTDAPFSDTLLAALIAGNVTVSEIESVIAAFGEWTINQTKKQG